MREKSPPVPARPSPAAVSPLRSLASGLPRAWVDLGIVVVRVVVKENQPFHSGAKREGDAIFHTAMPPADVRRIFRAIVLRIEDEQVTA